MKEYRKTFVSPGDGELPRLQPLARMQDIEAHEIDTGKLFGPAPIRTYENRDPLTEARAFMLKYAGLTLILLILAVGLTMRLELGFATGVLIFAALATGAYWLLGFTEAQFTGPGVERHRLTVGGRVLTRQIEAEERVRLAQIRLQRAQLTAQREMNQHAIETARERAMAHAWDIAALEPPQFAQGGTQTLRTDPARQALLDFLITLYERGDDGNWLHMDAHGYIAKGFVTPWSQRGGYTQTERRVMLDLLHRSRLAGFDDAKRAWRVSVTLYPDAQTAIDAVGAVEVMK